ncbi:GntR family transcriptional regulator [Epidermidibacterium keratini]|uniref:GntR family transcriptional regulator n=1 Tax=Epidermidibacterium keratini TaxID=1891644 RepID=A0A7L4YNN7_9ACTN|nr:GntR family transcriptional regulator [Epidermidibacterium keratini]QHC00770.1 GntR family transcriptional regulator [Epidermidibacterium keratini]
MLITIDPTSDVALHEQIASAARRAVANGEVTAGERLPAARDLAESLQVNMHTVLRAYNALRDEGLIELRRGRGAVVLANNPPPPEVNDAVADLVALARKHGIDARTLHAQIDERFAQ